MEKTRKKISNRLNNITDTIRNKVKDDKNHTLKIHINPVPASRPRITPHGVYYLKTYRDWRDAARKLLNDIEKTFKGSLVVIVENYVKRPKTTKRKYPKGDVDNYVKAPLDVITKDSNIWEDDDQVVGLWVTKQFVNEGEERTEVHIYEIEGEK